MILKKSILFCLSLVLLLNLSLSQVSAHSTSSNVDLPDGVTEVEKNDVKKYVGSLNRFKDFREARQWLNEEGFDMNREALGGLKFEKLVHPVTGEEMNDVVQTKLLFGNESAEDEIGVLEFIYDPENKELQFVHAQLLKGVQNGLEAIEFDFAQSYISDYGYTEEYQNFEEYRDSLDAIFGVSEGEFTTQNCGFSTNFVCIYHCGIWGVACWAGGPGAGFACGIACSVICSTGTHFACQYFA